MPYTVTWQRQCLEGAPVVEVSVGGSDYTNPDALVQKYRDEFETFADPREAVATAIQICRAWRRDGERRAKVAHGATGGMTLPFDPCTFTDLLAWAERQWEKLPKCDQCSGLLPERYYTLFDIEDEKFCSENCAEKRFTDAA